MPLILGVKEVTRSTVILVYEAQSSLRDSRIVSNRDGQDALLPHGTQELYRLLPLIATFARGYYGGVDRRVGRESRITHVLLEEGVGEGGGREGYAGG